MKTIVSLLCLFAITQASNLQTTTQVEPIQEQKCLENWHCPQNCCIFGQCRSDFLCQHQISKQLQSQLENEIDVETGSAKKCDANWQCGSYCCFLGSCKKDDFMCQNDKNYGESCAFNDDCNSGCCSDRKCSSYWACSHDKLEVSEAQIQEAQKNEIDVATGSAKECDANWQCGSYCCFLGSCKRDNFMCQNDRDLGESCAFNDDCNSGCCHNRKCSMYLACPHHKLEVAESAQKHLEKEIDVATGSAKECDANWRCDSNCCFLGSCRKSDFMCENDKNYGESCAFNDDCNSGCCSDRKCSSYWACSHDLEEQATDIVELQKISEEQSLQELEAQPCGMNWQCSSGCCYHGMCSANTLMCRNHQDMGGACQDNSNCNSGCCAYNVCVPYQYCFSTFSLDGSIEAPSQSTLEKYMTPEYQSHIKQQIASAKEKIGFQETELWGPCDYNFQCSSSCCLDGTCTIFSYSCGNQNATGDSCKENQDCLSSCCYDDGFTNETKCSPIQFCTYEKKRNFKHECKYNAECKSGCCAFGTCRKDMFWCKDQSAPGEDCYFNNECKSSCCNNGKCSYAMDCYTGKDLLRESNPELMVFYDYIEKFGSKSKNESSSIIEQDIELDIKPEIETTQTNLSLTTINAEKQRPWYLYVGIVTGVAVLIFVLVEVIRNRHKILNICKRKNTQEYSRLIEEEVVGRGDRL